MNTQEIIETIQEINGMAMLLGLTSPDQIQSYDPLFSNKFGTDVMKAFYWTIERHSGVYDLIDAGLKKHKASMEASK